MAYVLGFFAADGTLTFNRKRKNYYIEFTSTDYEIILKIKKIISAKQKISERKRKDNWKKAYRIQIGSKILFHDLVKLGFTPRKSKLMSFPEVPFCYLNHFIRGYFDGDGFSCIAYTKRKDKTNKVRVVLSGFISGSKEFLEKLSYHLENHAGIKGGTLYFHDRGHRLTYSLKDSEKLFEFMYKDSRENRLFLLRKYLKFKKIWGRSSVG